MSAETHRVHCPHCNAEVSVPAESSAGRARRRWYLGWLFLGLVLLAIVLVGYRYKGQIVTVIDLTNEVTGSTSLSVAALGLAAFVGACLVGWLVLPYFAAWAYLDHRCRSGPSPRLCQNQRSDPGGGVL